MFLEVRGLGEAARGIRLNLEPEDVRREVVSLLDRPVYTFREVDRLLGLNQGTTRRWIDGYRRSGDIGTRHLIYPLTFRSSTLAEASAIGSSMLSFAATALMKVSPEFHTRAG